YPGDGGYPRSVIAGPVAGEGGGFLSSTNAVIASGKRRLSQFLLRRFLVLKVEVFCGSAMDPWVAAVEISRRRRSPATVMLVEEEDSGGSRLACLEFLVIHWRKRSRSND
ncbi:unnamed protein product, partial [Brassica rapa subsp. trilocularis]